MKTQKQFIIESLMAANMLHNALVNGGATIEVKKMSNGDIAVKEVTFMDGFQISLPNTGEVVKLQDDQASTLKLLDAFMTAAIEVAAVNTVGERYGELPRYIGIWVEDGHMYIEHSVRIKDVNTALTMGRVFNQQAVYDWSQSICLLVGGTDEAFDEYMESQPKDGPEFELDFPEDASLAEYEGRMIEREEQTAEAAADWRNYLNQ